MMTNAREFNAYLYTTLCQGQKMDTFFLVVENNGFWSHAIAFVERPFPSFWATYYTKTVR